jgi:hypothetical protein
VEHRLQEPPADREDVLPGSLLVEPGFHDRNERILSLFDLALGIKEGALLLVPLLLQLVPPLLRMRGIPRSDVQGI